MEVWEAIAKGDTAREGWGSEAEPRTHPQVIKRQSRESRLGRWDTQREHRETEGVWSLGALVTMLHWSNIAMQSPTHKVR